MSESTLGEPVYNTYNDGKGVAVFEDHIECIEENAFEYCETLQKIVIPSSVTEIGDDAFCDCSSLEKVVFSSSDTEVSMSAFRGCVSLKAIYVPKDSVERYKEQFPRYMRWLIVEEGSDRPVKPEIVAKDILFSIRVITLDNETDSNILSLVKKKLEYMTDDEIVEWIVEHLEAITDSKEPYDEDEDAEEAECYKLPSYEYEDDEED